MSHHGPFKSLSPLSWSSDIASRDPSALTDLITSTLTNAQLLIDSIPTPTPPSSFSSTTGSHSSGRARSHTDSAVRPPPHAGSASSYTAGQQPDRRARTQEEKETVKKLGRDWKDLKVQQGGSGNPHGIAMYKMSAKDGKGAWFARRSLHRPPSSSSSSSGKDSAEGSGSGGWFDKWESALRREMGETLARVQGEPGKEPGTGNIRGIGAERWLEGKEGEAGRVDCESCLPSFTFLLVV